MLKEVEISPEKAPAAHAGNGAATDQRESQLKGTRENNASMTSGTIEVNRGGKLVTVPMVVVNAKTVVARGQFLKIAAVHDEWWLETEVEDPAACVQQLKEKRSGRLRADIFTFSQKVPGSPAKYQYPMEMESVAAARTTTFKEWWESLPQEARKNVRRSAKRGVTISLKEFDDDLIRGIADVNNDSPMRQGVRNVHYGKPFEQVKKDHASFLDRSDFICAYLGDEMIGFIKIVHCGQVAAILNIAVKPSHNDKRPANAMIAKAVELCEAKGALFLTYRLFNYGNKKDSPLQEFKRRNGFEEILTPRYFVPITAWGAVAMKANLHRGLLGILPSSLITAGLNARSRWYDFKKSVRK
jgi:acetyltransferase (GNAT) family protein